MDLLFKSFIYLFLLGVPFNFTLILRPPVSGPLFYTLNFNKQKNYVTVLRVWFCFTGFIPYTSFTHWTCFMHVYFLMVTLFLLLLTILLPLAVTCFTCLTGFSVLLVLTVFLLSVSTN